VAALKVINMALAFFLELCLLAAFFYWGVQTGNGLALQIILGIGAPLVVAIIWGMLLAPKAARRLRGAPYLLLKYLLFGLAALALAAVGQTVTGVVLFAAALLNQTLLHLWES
jgi:Na+-transporting NADH:ubiquinone oxidoreductase subunit NqrE